MKRALVLGLGLSGRAAAEFLRSRGCLVVAADRNPCMHEPFSVVSDLSPIDLDGLDLLVLSPGVAPTHPLCQAARQRGIRILGEAELAFQHVQQRAVAITGTNGKTTVALMVQHILACAGLPAKAVGNVGLPLTRYLMQPSAEEILVVELSSYQLETLQSARFEAGVILNITPDHLDRYGNMEAYAAAKCRLEALMLPQAPLYVHESVIREYGHLLRRAKPLTKLATFLPLRYRTLGIHERINAVAAWALVQRFGVDAVQFCEALATFCKPAHRIQFVRVREGVSFFDDSKGTNVDAVIQAVHSMSGPVVLIAGGVDKGASFMAWRDAFAQKVKCLILLGEAKEKMARELQDVFCVERVDTLQQAVDCAVQRAQVGDQVLLSPGCASFDMFRDYVHRGEEFKRIVELL